MYCGLWQAYQSPNNHRAMVQQRVVCINVTQLNFITAFPKSYDKHATRDSSKGGKPSTAAIARHICEHHGHLLTPEDPEQRPMEFMVSRARLICENPDFSKPFNAASAPSKTNKTRKVGTDLEEAALMESVIESIAQTFKNLKKFSENVPTITVVVPDVQPASMTEVCVVWCVFLHMCAHFLTVVYFQDVFLRIFKDTDSDSADSTDADGVGASAHVVTTSGALGLKRKADMVYTLPKTSQLSQGTKSNSASKMPEV